MRSRPGSILLWSTAVVFVLTSAIRWLGPLVAAFGFVPLPPGTVAAIAAILVGYIAATEAAKARFYRARPATV